MPATTITLRAFDANPATIVLRALATTPPAANLIILRAFAVNPTTILCGAFALAEVTAIEAHLEPGGLVITGFPLTVGVAGVGGDLATWYILKLLGVLE